MFRFETPEKALKFDYTAKVKNIMYKIEIEDFAFIIYEKRDGQLADEYLTRDKMGWKTSIRRFVLANKFKMTFNYSIIGHYEMGKNLLIISSWGLEEDDIIKNVSDSLKTNFESVSYEYNGIYYTNWIGIIEKYPEDYQIYLDEEAVKL